VGICEVIAGRNAMSASRLGGVSSEAPGKPGERIGVFEQTTAKGIDGLLALKIVLAGDRFREVNRSLQEQIDRFI
jgi:hypothetical protein